eukprot:6975040-Prymnesium_polylepis.1
MHTACTTPPASPAAAWFAVAQYVEHWLPDRSDGICDTIANRWYARCTRRKNGTFAVRGERRGHKCAMPRTETEPQ